MSAPVLLYRNIVSGIRKLIYTKRGIPVTLHYYHLPEALWDALAMLIVLRKQKLEGRLKNLPNIGQGIERLSWKASIQNVDALRNHSAKASYLKLRNIKRDLSVKVLSVLEGVLAPLPGVCETN